MVLPAQAGLGGWLVEGVTAHAALILALCSAGRHLAGAAGLAGAAVAAAVPWATWVAFSPPIRDAADALLMLVYIPLRWSRAAGCAARAAAPRAGGEGARARARAGAERPPGGRGGAYAHRPQLVEGIRVVAAGEALLAPTVTRRLIERADHPARPAAGAGRAHARELEVLRLVARRKSNAEIAAELVVGDTTVKTHVTRTLNKLGLRDRVQGVVLAYESGLVAPGRE